jgi:hypothetical protein
MVKCNAGLSNKNIVKIVTKTCIAFYYEETLR